MIRFNIITETRNPHILDESQIIECAMIYIIESRAKVGPIVYHQYSGVNDVIQTPGRGSMKHDILIESNRLRYVLMQRIRDPATSL